MLADIGRSLDPDRFEALFASLGLDGEIGAALRRDGYQARAYARKHGFDPSLFWKIFRLLRNEQIDLIQTHHISSLIYGGAMARLTGARLVHTEHEIQSFRSSPRNLRWLRLLAPLVHRFVAIDPLVKRFLVAEAGIAERRVCVIRNGVDLERFRPADRPPRRPDAPFLAGWVGRLTAPKRPDVVIDALVRLRDRCPSLRLRFVGPGELLKESRGHAEQAGLADRIEILGPREDIADQLRQLDCFVLCSDTEGLPIALVEAMATGLCCVASSVGGIPSLIRHGANGLLLDANLPALLADFLAQLYATPNWAHDQGRRARESAARDYDARKTVAEYARLFEELLQGV